MGGGFDPAAGLSMLVPFVRGQRLDAFHISLCTICVPKLLLPVQGQQQDSSPAGQPLSG